MNIQGWRTFPTLRYNNKAIIGTSDWYSNYFTYFLPDLACGLYKGFLQVLQPLAANLQRPHPSFLSGSGWTSSAGGSCDARGLRFWGNAFMAFMGLALAFADFMADFLLGAALGFDFRGRPLLPEVDARVEVLKWAWSWGVTSDSWPWPAKLKGKNPILMLSCRLREFRLITWIMLLEINRLQVYRYIDSTETMASMASALSSTPGTTSRISRSMGNVSTWWPRTYIYIYI